MGHVWNTGKFQIVHMDLGRRLITFIEKEKGSTTDLVR